MHPGRFLFVAQTVDATGLQENYENLRLQVIAASAALYICVKLQETPLELDDPQDPLYILVDRASLFLERATNRLIPVSEADVLREEYLLLGALEFDATTLTGERWVEVLFKRTDRVM